LIHITRRQLDVTYAGLVSGSFDFDRELLRHLPPLRAYARKLTKDRADAEDLVQDACVRAIAHCDAFEPDTNFAAWIFTILRNRFRSNLARNSRMRFAREIPEISVPGSQESSLLLRDHVRLLRHLAPGMRSALLMIAGGLGYCEAAARAGTRVGTIKSRVSRARSAATRSIIAGPQRQAQRGATMKTETPHWRTWADDYHSLARELHEPDLRRVAVHLARICTDMSGADEAIDGTRKPPSWIYRPQTRREATSRPWRLREAMYDVMARNSHCPGDAKGWRALAGRCGEIAAYIDATSADSERRRPHHSQMMSPDVPG